MNAKQANQISIRNYLSSIGINPVRSNKSSTMYLAPYRAETIPSLKVRHDQNLWVDYGNDNKGGTLIDLVLLLNPSYDVSDAIRAVENSTQSFFSFHQQQSLCLSRHEIDITKYDIPKPKSGFRNTNVEKGKTENEIAKCCTNKRYTINQQNLKPISCTINSYYLKDVGNNPAITDYLKKRGIYPETAKPFCKEIYYTIGKKKYFGLASENTNGWSIRNKYWKGCTAQGYSHYKKGYERLCVFEGIFDLLSYIELTYSKPTASDFLVLNSLVNQKSAFSLIKNYKQVNLFLDHDQAGRNTTELLLELLPNSRDSSRFYSTYKDLNEYHVAKVKGRMTKVKW